MPTDMSIKNWDLFSTIDDQEFVNLMAGTILIQFKKGTVLYEAGEEAKHVYLLKSGSLKLVRIHSEGRDRIVHILLRGEVFGAVVALNNGLYPLRVQGLEEGSCLKIERDIFKQLFMAHPKLGAKLMLQISQRMISAHDDRLNTIESVDKRVALFLLDLLERIQKIYGPTSQINLPLTKQDIAERVASTVETVIRVMGQWSKSNLIAIKDRHIEIPDIALLKQNVMLE